MSKLLNTLETVKPKTAYQSYTVQHGIERVTVLVPLASAQVFEQSFNSLTEKTKKSILQLVEQAGGKVRR